MASATGWRRVRHRFLTILVGLTDGLESPFFVGYFLLVGGAALAWDGLGPIALALRPRWLRRRGHRAAARRPGGVPT